MRNSNDIGMRGFARVLRRLHDEPLTARKVQQMLNFYKTQDATKLLRGMSTLGLAHVGSWERITHERHGASNLPRWHYGPGADAPRPTGVQSFRSPPSAPGATLIAFAYMVRALSTGMHSQAELVDECGLNRETVRVQIIYMRRIGLVRIAGWEVPPIGAHIRLYSIGVNRRDAPRLKPISDAERSSLYRAGRQAKTDSLEILRALAGKAQPYREAVAA